MPANVLRCVEAPTLLLVWFFLSLKVGVIPKAGWACCMDACLSFGMKASQDFGDIFQ